MPKVGPPHQAVATETDYRNTAREMMQMQIPLTLMSTQLTDMWADHLGSTTEPFL